MIAQKTTREIVMNYSDDKISTNQVWVQKDDVIKFKNEIERFMKFWYEYSWNENGREIKDLKEILNKFNCPLSLDDERDTNFGKDEYKLQ